MDSKSQKFLKKMDKLAEYKSNFDVPLVIILFFLSFCFLFILISISILGSFIELGFNYKDFATSILFFVCSIILLCMSWISLRTKYKIKKEYGENSKEKMISSISDNCTIKEIQEYYNSSSNLFRVEYLDKIFEKEIANSLGLKDGYNKSEVLKEIECKNKLEIENT